MTANLKMHRHVAHFPVRACVSMRRLKSSVSAAGPRKRPERSEKARRGAGPSGGIDSSVTAALCARALGGQKVTGIFMPEYDSDPESLRLGKALAKAIGVETVLEDIGPALAASGCYERRDNFIRQIVPEFDEGWGCKVVLENALSSRGYNISWLVVQNRKARRAVTACRSMSISA